MKQRIQRLQLLRRIAARLVLGAGTSLALTLLGLQSVRADNCSSLQDCFNTVSSAAQVTAGVIVLVVAVALALPTLLRANRPAEVDELQSTRGPTPTGAAGPSSTVLAPPPTSSDLQTLAGARPQDVPLQQSGLAPFSPQINVRGIGSGMGQGIDLPNLPDTPDVPDAPETIELSQAAEGEVNSAVGSAAAGAGGEAAPDAERARQYTPEALAQMQALGVSAAMVEDIIHTGRATVESEHQGVTRYTASERDVTVRVDALTGVVLSVLPGQS